MAKDTGVALIQTLLKFEGGHQRLAVDGLIGNQTRTAYANTAPLVVQQIKRTVKAATGGNSDELIGVEKTTVKEDDFGAVVLALQAAARKAGLIPSAVVAQVVHESGWGRSALSRRYNNYAGLKYNAVARYPGVKVNSTQMMTHEYVDGRRVEMSDGFAVFDSVAHFADAYVWYLTESPSSYRYKGIVNASDEREYFTILKDGGYATDPKYVDSLVNVHRSVVRRYPEVVTV